MLLISRQGLGTSGEPTSGSSIEAARNRPMRPMKAFWLSMPNCNAILAEPMFDEKVKTSGRLSTRCGTSGSSWIVKRSILIGELASSRDSMVNLPLSSASAVLNTLNIEPCSYTPSVARLNSASLVIVRALLAS